MERLPGYKIKWKTSDEEQWRLFFVQKVEKWEYVHVYITITCTRLKKHLKDFKKMIYMEIF